MRTPEQQSIDEIETYALSPGWDRNGWSRGLPPSFNILTDTLFTTILNSSLLGIAVHSEFQMVQFLQNLETTSSVPLFGALACFFQLDHQCATVGNCVEARNHRFFILLLSPIRKGWTSRLRRPPTSPQMQDMDKVIEYAGIRKSLEVTSSGAHSSRACAK